MEPVDGSLIYEIHIGHSGTASVWIDLYDCGVLMIGTYGLPSGDQWGMGSFIDSWYNDVSSTSRTERPNL